MSRLRQLQTHLCAAPDWDLTAVQRNAIQIDFAGHGRMALFRTRLQNFVAELNRCEGVEQRFHPLLELGEARGGLGVENGENLLQIATLHTGLQRLQDIPSYRILKIERLLARLSLNRRSIVRKGCGWLLRPAWNRHQQNSQNDDACRMPDEFSHNSPLGA